VCKLSHYAKEFHRAFVLQYFSPLPYICLKLYGEFKMPASSLCADCQTKDGTHDVRKRRLCTECFVRYVNSKVLKRMESYRFKNVGDQKKRLLLPLSGGVSSMCLLHVLDSQLKKQLEKQNRTAYELVLVHVSTFRQDNPVSTTWDRQVAEQFSSYHFSASFALEKVFSIDSSISQDLTHLGIHRRENENDAAFYTRIQNSTTSVTTRADLDNLFLHRLLVALAKQYNCDSILWGHSDSTLAAQALASVAKGRGGAVPADLADGPGMAGITFNHPMRDLFKTELELYASVLPEQLPCIPDLKAGQGPIVSIKNTSIDDLLSTYINSQGEKYPSIMANVVRTASKLQVPKVGPDARHCPVCQSRLPEDGDVGRTLCYGCVRMKQDIKTEG
jgi:cytoplasmic tRNA 2-thiolation protein 2